MAVEQPAVTDGPVQVETHEHYTHITAHIVVLILAVVCIRLLVALPCFHNIIIACFAALLRHHTEHRTWSRCSLNYWPVALVFTPSLIFLTQ